MRLDEYLRKLREEQLKRLLEEIREKVRELCRRDPVLYYVVHVHNTVTGESWRVELDTKEDVEEYLRDLSRPARGVQYRIYEFLPGIYDVGPWRVSVFPVRKSTLKRARLGR